MAGCSRWVRAMSDDVPGALRSQGDFEAAVRWALGHALAVRSRRMVWVDADFANWPLDDALVLSRLAEWLRLPQRHLLVLARSFDGVPRRHPRFVAWRRDWSHAIDALSPSAGVDVSLPTLLLDDDRLCLQVFDAQHWRGRLQLDDHAARQWRDEIDVLLQRCEPSFPVQTLGL